MNGIIIQNYNKELYNNYKKITKELRNNYKKIIKNCIIIDINMF